MSLEAASTMIPSLESMTGISRFSIPAELSAIHAMRDMQSGMMVTGGRLNHLAAGNTMWNPAYRQHVMQNMGKNWGPASGGSINNK